jgi:hypothetical protein
LGFELRDKTRQRKHNSQSDGNNESKSKSKSKKMGGMMQSRELSSVGEEALVREWRRQAGAGLGVDGVGWQKRSWGSG